LTATSINFILPYLRETDKYNRNQRYCLADVVAKREGVGVNGGTNFICFKLRFLPGLSRLAA
jgi:hypothetical protein